MPIAMNEDDTKRVEAQRPPRTRDAPVDSTDYSDAPPFDFSTSVRVRDYPDLKSATEAARRLYLAKQQAAE